MFFFIYILLCDFILNYFFFFWILRTEKTDPGAYWLWLGTGASTPGLPEALHLYQNIIELGIEPIILSDRWKLWKNVTLDNLEAAGVTYWKHLILK